VSNKLDESNLLINQDDMTITKAVASEFVWILVLYVTEEAIMLLILKNNN
jgi:hypothetical protein